jgi:hypothetical protein
MVLEYAPEFASSQHCDILEVWAGPVLMVRMGTGQKFRWSEKKYKAYL